jgi:hypothetical protein
VEEPVVEGVKDVKAGAVHPRQFGGLQEGPGTRRGKLESHEDPLKHGRKPPGSLSDNGSPKQEPGLWPLFS